MYLHNITNEASQRVEDSNADEITYSCDICETTYDCPSDLNTHNNAMHERSESYSCDQSEYEATNNCLLPQHAMTSHPSLSCDECEFTAKNKGGLTRHRNAQHKNSKKLEEPSNNNLVNPSATSHQIVIATGPPPPTMIPQQPTTSASAQQPATTPIINEREGGRFQRTFKVLSLNINLEIFVIPFLIKRGQRNVK